MEHPQVETFVDTCITRNIKVIIVSVSCYAYIYNYYLNEGTNQQNELVDVGPFSNTTTLSG
jgi:hypothetical protein